MAQTIHPEPRIFRLFTNGHCTNNDCWDDYVDFNATEQSLVFNRYSYDMRNGDTNCNVLSKEQLTDTEKTSAIQVLRNFVKADPRVVSPTYYIGPHCFYIPCTVKGSRKYNGKAVWTGIVSRRDYFHRECYRATIQSEEGVSYEISLNCIKPNCEFIYAFVDSLTLEELTDVVDELRHGKIYYGHYNNHLFHFSRLLVKTARMSVP